MDRIFDVREDYEVYGLKLVSSLVVWYREVFYYFFFLFGPAFFIALNQLESIFTHIKRTRRACSGDMTRTRNAFKLKTIQMTSSFSRYSFTDKINGNKKEILAVLLGSVGNKENKDKIVSKKL